jgi:head-tail adaptor
MQVAGDKAAAILGVGGRVGSARARAETIGIVRVSVKVRREVSAKVRIKVSTEIRMATTKKIRRTRTGLIIRVFRGFKVRVRSSGES